MKKLTIIAGILFSTLPFAMAEDESQVITMSVVDEGFSPSSIDVKPGTSVTLKITRKTDATCATEIKIPSKKIKKTLPLNKEVTIKLGTLKNGEIRFVCGMDMISGVIHVK